MSDDPWKYRSAKMKCGKCMWFVQKEPLNHPPTEGVPPRIGRCRKRAPTMNGYPVVFVQDWCGDHKIDEDKI